MKAFLTPKFLFAYLDFIYSNEVKPYMIKGNLIDNRPRTYDTKTNEIRFDHFEDLIKRNKYYTPERLSVFYQRDSVLEYSPVAINDNQINLLHSMNKIFLKHKTNLKVIISPLYDQERLNPFDLEYLQSLFGINSVFDFSGINPYTQDYRNFYESSHYRPHVAREIMYTVYNN